MSHDIRETIQKGFRPFLRGFAKFFMRHCLKEVWFLFLAAAGIILVIIWDEPLRTGGILLLLALFLPCAILASLQGWKEAQNALREEET